MWEEREAGKAAKQAEWEARQAAKAREHQQRPRQPNAHPTPDVFPLPDSILERHRRQSCPTQLLSLPPPPPQRGGRASTTIVARQLVVVVSYPYIHGDVPHEGIDSPLLAAHRRAAAVGTQGIVGPVPELVVEKGGAKRDRSCPTRPTAARRATTTTTASARRPARMPRRQA